VQYRNLPRNLEIGSDIAETVHLILRGPSLVLSRVASNPSPVIVDLRETRGPGEKTFSITANSMRLPGGVTLERAVPGQIRVRLEWHSTRSVLVRVRTEKVPEGSRAEILSVYPAQLVIAGPESRVRNIEQVETDPVDVRNLEPGGLSRTVAYTADPRVSFTKDPSVEVHIKIVPSAKN
jgi:YbbR domain-containing protein